MALVLREVLNFLKYYIYDARDKRLEHYLFNGTPINPAVVLIPYLYFVHKLGPALMANRKPFELKRVMIVYNLTQVIANFALVCAGIKMIYDTEKNLKCGLVDYSNTPNAIYEAQLSYYYYLLKIIDLMDTVLFILRKKFKQASFLHVYHHFLTVAIGYCVANYSPGGHMVVFGIINSFIHSVMYFYYFLTCISTNVKESLWWKKYITQMQFVQFIIAIIHFSLPLVTDCQYSKGYCLLGITQNVFMVVLFGDFYYKAYLKKPKKEMAE